MNKDTIRRVAVRAQSRAEELSEDYARAADLMQDAIRGAMPWASMYVTKRIPPSCTQMVELAAQLIAIAAACSPDPKVRE